MAWGPGDFDYKTSTQYPPTGIVIVEMKRSGHTNITLREWSFSIVARGSA